MAILFDPSWYSNFLSSWTTIVLPFIEVSTKFLYLCSVDTEHFWFSFFQLESCCTKTDKNCNWYWYLSKCKIWILQKSPIEVTCLGFSQQQYTCTTRSFFKVVCFDPRSEKLVSRTCQCFIQNFFLLFFQTRFYSELPTGRFPSRSQSAYFNLKETIFQHSFARRLFHQKFDGTKIPKSCKQHCFFAKIKPYFFRK